MIGAVGTLVLFAANGRTASLITDADTFGKTRDAELRLQPVSAWPDRLLMEDKWTQSIASDGRALWESPIAAARQSGLPPPRDLLVRENEETLAWIRVLPFGDRYVWPYGPLSDRLKDGGTDVELRTVVSKLGVGDFVRSSEPYPVEIVGVGLESAHGGDPEDVARLLSWRRSILLAQTTGQSIVVTDTSRRIRFRGLSLGRALTNEPKETLAEQRQRSALIVAVVFMKHDAVNLRLDEELLRTIFRLRLQGVDLMNYEYSFSAMSRLTAAIAVAGGGDGPLSPPTMTANEAMKSRQAEEQR